MRSLTRMQPRLSRGVLLASLGLAGLSALLPFSAGAQALIDETQLVALPAVVPPQEYRFAVPSAQALNLTLTDLQTPKKFTSLQVVVTLNDGLVGQASVPAGAPSVTLPIPAIVSPAAGSEYVVRVVGTPDATQNVGAFGVCVSSATDPTNACIAADSISGTLVTPQPASTSGAAALQTSFTTSAAAGPYVVTLTDDRFPAPLQQLAAGVALNSTPINSSPILAGTPTTLTLAANTTYQLDVAALADAATTAGLYGVHIVDPNGTTVFDRIIPVGELAPPAPVTVTSAQSVALTLTDEAYPAPLVKAMAAVTSGSAALAVLTTPGTQTGIAVPAGTVDVWTYTAAGTQPGVYDLSLGPSGTPLYATTQVVEPSGVSANGAFAFLVQGLASGASYALAVTDLKFPSQLAALTGTVAQGGVALPLDSSGHFTAASSGSAVVVVDAQAPQTGSGIFDVAVTDQNGSAPSVLLDQTQSVGARFTTRSLTVPTAGHYQVALTDLKFPAAFANLDLAVNQGAQVLGSIYGAGVLPLDLSAGTYQITVVDAPAASGYGLYALNVAQAAPSVTFSANANAVTAGQPVQLTWSSQDASSCSASGASGWSGSEALSGSASVTVTASVTLSLTCTGAGGSTTQSVAVTANPAPSSSGSGGGGGLDLSAIAMLGLLVAARAARRAAAH